MDNFLTIVTENWFLIVVAAILMASVFYHVYEFIKKPNEEQIRAFKEWLLYAVIQAEKEFGSGTGIVKLRYVYDMFIKRFSWLAKFITFEMFSDYVEDSLKEMEYLLDNNINIGIKKESDNND